MVIEWVWVEVGWMVVGVVVVGLVEVQVVVAESMNFVADFVGIVDKGKVDMVADKADMIVDKAVDMAVGKAADMADFLEHTLANLEEIGFGFAKEAKLAKAWVHSMNFEWDFGNSEEIVEE
jgi:hypothetical protein